MKIDDLLELAGREEKDCPLTVPQEWSQGRTTFGGLITAMVYEAMRKKVAPGRQLRSIFTSFVKPLRAEEPFTIEVDILSQGKTITNLRGKTIQKNEISSLVQACFVSRNPSSIEVKGEPGPEFLNPDKGKPLKHIPHLTPDFIQYIDMRWTFGDFPYSGSQESRIDGWMRFHDTPDQIGDGHIIALVDAWPPTVLPLLKRPSPASTVNWNVELIHPRKQIPRENYLAYRAITRHAQHGFAHVEASIWNDQRELIALSRQTVVTYEKGIE